MLLLVVGAATGIILAASGLVGAGYPAGPTLPRNAVARINGEIIRRDEYERTVAALAADRRDGVDATQQRRVLDRLIDEELLVQRGLELGLANNDRRVRADITAAVIASILADTNDEQPTDPELRQFYDDNRAFFTRPGRMHLRQVFCRCADAGQDAAARQRATEATRRLRAGEAFATVREALGDPEISPLPDAPLPAEKLLDYLGPTALHIALALAADEISDPIRSSAGYHVLQVVERQPDVTPPLADITAQVAAEFRRQAGDRALREYLDDLRSRADVAIDPTLR